MQLYCSDFHGESHPQFPQNRLLTWQYNAYKKPHQYWGTECLWFTFFKRDLQRLLGVFTFFKCDLQKLFVNSFLIFDLSCLSDSVWVSVCVCVCVHVWVWLGMCVGMWVWIGACKQAFVWHLLHTNVIQRELRMHETLRACVFTCTCGVCVCVYVCARVRACVLLPTSSSIKSKL